MSRKLTAAIASPAALLAVLVAVALVDTSTALGPTIAVTPDEVIPDGPIGEALHPDISDRGRSVGVFDNVRVGEFRDRDIGFVHLDDGDQEPMTSGVAITVSGDGCTAVSVEPGTLAGSGSPVLVAPTGTAPSWDFIRTNRCTGASDLMFQTNQFQYVAGQNGIALDHDGSMLAIELQITENAAIIGRIDFDDSDNTAIMPAPSFGLATSEFGMDISDDGDVVVLTGSNFEQTEVLVWNVPTATVDIISNPGLSETGWSAYPSISGEGRFVAYAASRPRTGAESGIGPWVYVHDRTNGAVVLASRPAGAGYDTSIADDGTQVAYQSLPAGCRYDNRFLDDLEFDCLPTQIEVAFSSAIGLTGPLQREVVSVLANGAEGGHHLHPELSGNGRWVTWVSSNGNQLIGSDSEQYVGQHAFLRRRDASIQVSDISYGPVLAPGSSVGTSIVVNSGRSTIDVAAIESTGGEFVIVGGSCASGVSLPPGAQCTVDVRFDAATPARPVNGTLTVRETGYDAVSGSGRLTGTVDVTTTTTTTTTTQPTVVITSTTTTTTTTTLPTIGTTPPNSVGVLPPAPNIQATPNPLDFGDSPVFIPGDQQTVTVTNVGTGGGDVVSTITGEHAGDFMLVGGTCQIGTLLRGRSCTLDYRMTATASGPRQALLTLTAGTSEVTVDLVGVGRFEPQIDATPRTVTERGITVIVGRGFPPDQPVTVRIDGGVENLDATPGADGTFRIPAMPLGRFSLGPHTISVDGVDGLYDAADGQFVVVLPTFAPQGPTGPAFQSNRFVARG